MTRRDYLFLSNALRRAYVAGHHELPGRNAEGYRQGVLSAAALIARDLSLQSAGFDSKRFLLDVTEGPHAG